MTTNPHKKLKPDKIKMLFTWAKCQGAKFHKIQVTDSSGLKDTCRKAKTLKNIDKFSEICFIPKEILLSESVAKNSEIGQVILKYFNENDFEVIDERKYPHCVDVICMAAFMVYEYKRGDSFWDPYLQILPMKFNLPVCWDKDVINSLLGGTFLQKMTLLRLEWLKSVYKIISRFDFHGKLDFGLFLWAYCSITSRAFPKTVKSKIDIQEKGIAGEDRIDTTTHEDDWICITEICLYPVLDMFNHNKDCKIVWKMTPDGVSFVAQEDIAKGAEVFNNYGPKGNEVRLSVK
jgi:hypothetical protein